MLATNGHRGVGTTTVSPVVRSNVVALNSRFMSGYTMSGGALVADVSRVRNPWNISRPEVRQSEPSAVSQGWKEISWTNRKSG